MFSSSIWDGQLKFDQSNWVVLQCFMMVSLVASVIALFAMKEKLWIAIYRSISMGIAIIAFFVYMAMGGPFNSGGTIVCSVAFLSSMMGIYQIYKPNKMVKYIGMGLIAVVQFVLNAIVFYNNWTNILSAVYGLLCVNTFLQTTAKRVRFCFLLQALVGVVYYFVQLPTHAPINAITQVINVIATVMGIVKFDILKQMAAKVTSKTPENKEEAATPETTTTEASAPESVVNETTATQEAATSIDDSNLVEQLKDKLEEQKEPTEAMA